MPKHPETPEGIGHSLMVAPPGVPATSTLPVPVNVSAALPKRWDGKLAYIISQVGSPPMQAIAGLALSAYRFPHTGAWAWAGIYLVLAVLSPIFYIAWLVRRGLVTDLDVQLREQRTKPMLVATGCAGAGWLILKLGSAPLQIITLASALLIQSTIMFIITIYLRWKISMHSAAAAGAATLAWCITGTPLALLVSVPLVAWSRVRLRRHTLAQTLAGAALGCAIFLTTLWLMQR